MLVFLDLETELSQFSFGPIFWQWVDIVDQCPAAAIKLNGNSFRCLGAPSGMSSIPLCGRPQRYREKVGSLEEKMTLCADNMVLFLHDSDSSLSAVKVDCQKSKILPLRAPCPTVHSQIAVYFNVLRRYLGLNLSNSVSGFIPLNVLPLLQTLKSRLQTWQKIPWEN